MSKRNSISLEGARAVQTFQRTNFLPLRATVGALVGEPIVQECQKVAKKSLQRRRSNALRRAKRAGFLGA